VIRGATICDGSGKPRYTGDVAVEAGTIRQVGGKAGPARREVDGDGLVAAPGFVDGHTHMDAQLLWDPQVTSSCYHGVTSIVTGNCGLSLAPCKPEDRDILLQTFSHVEGMDIGLLRRAVEWSWTDMAGYMNAVEAMRPALNVGMLVGHCPLRQYVMGEDAIKRAATADEIAAMQALLREALNSGLLGFSTNRNERHFREDGEPLPSRLAEWEELEALGQVLADLDRGVIQMSSAGQDAARVASLADFSLRTGRPVVWNSILHRWSKPDEWRELLDATAKGFERGARAWANTNVRPFNNRFNLIDGQEFDEFPTWRGLMFSPIEERRAAFQDPEVRKKLRWEVVEDSAPAAFHRRWELVYIVKPATEKNAHLKGANVADYARSQGKDVFDAFMDLSLEEDLATGFQTAHTNGDADAVGAIVSNPYTVLGQSDAGAHVAIDAGFGYCTLLLAKYVRERGDLSLEEGVRKLTSMQADICGITDRGRLEPGMAADVVVFDPATVAPREPELLHDFPGGAARLAQYADGIHTVLVNGQVALEDGAPTGERSGKVLRNGV
jgi:N-acyl-D-aspartate/D-glutamate deacylase